jgi:hypothetical protein
MRLTVFDDFYLTIVDSDLLIGKGGDQSYIKLDRITNFRIQKSRNLIINVIIVFIIMLCCYLVVDSYQMSPFLQIILAGIIVLCLWLSFLLRFYSYTLLINTGESEFNEIVIPKNHVLHANIVLNFILNKKVLSESHKYDLYE